MRDTPGRVFGLVCGLVAVWIVTYWLYEPGEPPVSFAEPPSPVSAPERERGRAVGEDRGAEQREVESVIGVGEGTVVVPPRFREIVVEHGDTGWEAIAERVYGDGRHWRAVARANPFVTPDRLIPGRTRLRIPVDPGNVQGLVVKAPVEEQEEEEGDRREAAASAPPAPEPEFVEYIIKPGDTLSGIAQRVYGSTGAWRRIHEANRDVIPNPDRLPVGATIRLPPPG